MFLGRPEPLEGLFTLQGCEGMTFRGVLTPGIGTGVNEGIRFIVGVLGVVGSVASAPSLALRAADMDW